MKLKTIDKSLYRKRLNILITVCIVILLITSLGVSNLLIVNFGSEVNGDNFIWNLLGVAIGGVVLFTLLKMLSAKPYMFEVSYVRSLKREMNRIYRSSKKLQSAIAVNDERALTISYFNLRASKQVYELDDNTLIMPELNEKIRLLDVQIESLGLTISTEDYRPELLDQINAD
jgi:hypothetical protein